MECWRCEAEAVRADVFCEGHGGETPDGDTIRQRALMGALLEDDDGV